ncbi:MAG: hypothetical protein Q9173_004099 [Seirophora scorigena]
MFFAQDRGITPPEQEDEPQTIEDPELLALLEGNRQRGRIIRAELIQAAIDEQHALYQPPPDIRTPDRQPSPPVGGLPSPDSSPRPGYHQLVLTHPPHTTTPSLPLSNHTVSTLHSSTLPPAHSASAATPGLMFSSLTSSAPRSTTPPPAQSPPAATPGLIFSSLTSSAPRSSAFHSNSSHSGTRACWSLRKPRPSQDSCHGAYFHDCSRLSSAVNVQSNHRPFKTRIAAPQAKQPKQLKTADTSPSHTKHRTQTTRRARVSPPSAMITRSKVTPYTTFRELGKTLQRRRTTATKPGSSRKTNNVLHGTARKPSSLPIDYANSVG